MARVRQESGESTAGIRRDCGESPARVRREPPTGVCGEGTILDASTQQCEIACSDEPPPSSPPPSSLLGRHLDEAREEGAPVVETAAAVVDGFLARHAEAAPQLNEETIALKQELGQDFGLPALA